LICANCREIERAIADFTQQDLKTLVRACFRMLFLTVCRGSLEQSVKGGTVKVCGEELTQDDVKVTWEYTGDKSVMEVAEMRDWILSSSCCCQAASDGDLLVVLNAELTPALVTEGMAR
jgi:hypothetical protein